MKITVWIPFALLVALFSSSGCSPFLKIYAEEEPGVNLYKYTTFSWLNNPTSVQGNSGPLWQNQRNHEKIRSSVEAQLQGFGFSRCDQSPDLMLHYHVVVKNEVLYVRDQWCDEEHWNLYGRCNRVRPVNYQEGMLIIDFIDSKTGNQVWRGAAVAVEDNLSPAQIEARIAEAIRLIFTKFPQKKIKVV